MNDILQVIFPEILGALTVSAVIYMVFTLRRLYQRSTVINFDKIEDSLEKSRLEIKKSLAERIKKTSDWQDRIHKKKSNILNTPNISFHFANHDQIKVFYDEYFKEATIENIVNEAVSESSGEIKGKLPSILEAKIGDKGVSKWISSIKLPETSTVGMFKRYQRETISNNQVTLGVEELDIELSETEDFKEKTEELKKKYGFDLDESKVKRHISKLNERAADSTIKKLENISGWVLVEGKFKINEDSEYYQLTLDHPVSEYLTSEKSVTISCRIKKNDLENSYSGNYSSSVGRKIPMKVYGQIWQPLNKGDFDWEVQVSPLAIY